MFQLARFSTEASFSFKSRTRSAVDPTSPRNCQRRVGLELMAASMHKPFRRFRVQAFAPLGFSFGGTGGGLVNGQVAGE